MPDNQADFKTILVLDDDPQFHKLVVPVLTNRGHRVLSAHTGKEASVVMNSESVDLAIVDGQLPDTTGLDWIAEMRSTNASCLIMFVSAFWRDASSYHRLTKELGVSLVLHKPVLAAVFAAEVDLLLGKTVVEDQSADFEDTLLALRAEYAKELPTRLKELDTLLLQLKAQPNDRFAASEVRTHAHRLRGTAASYGFKEIGDAAGQIEDILVALNPGTHSVSEAISQLEEILRQAEKDAQEAAKDVESRIARLKDRPLVQSSPADELSAIARILVVDDDAAFLDLIDELAKQHQLEVVSAHSAAEAKEMACLYEIGAALIDVELGSRDVAFKLASDLRLLPGYSDLPLGFLSGAGHIEQMIEVDSIGQCLYIDRPLQSDALDAAVRQLSAIKEASKPAILIVDDDSEFLKRIAFVLTHEGMRVDTLTDTADILEQMQAINPDVLLLDVMMPGVSGFDICRMLRTLPRWRDLPIIFLTAFDDVDTRVACLRCGGDDYLLKPVVNEELLVRLRMRLERARLLKERLERDNVSGLLLRRPFMQQLSAMITEGRRHGWSVCVVLLQIVGLNDFKRKVVSDLVLSALGELLTKRLHAADIKGQWSGDKLIVAVRHESAVEVKALLGRIAEEFVSTQHLQQEERPGHLALAYGVAAYPQDGGTMYELLALADRRLSENSLALVSRARR